MTVPTNQRRVPAQRAVLRSAGALLAGLVAVVVLSSAADLAFEALAVFPPPERFGAFTTANYLLALSYRAAFNIFGCWLAARLAPNRPMRHALILGAIGFVLASLGLVVMWSVGDHWYPIALVVSAFPCAWIGGKLHRPGAV